ncbi:HlyD family secretion protein [Olivibacter jilunii]|uniref:HlyD family secretion protein n=1 Tax=Olivibacter jilunii TaxID=985016 RepID=UPI003F16168D
MSATIKYPEVILTDLKINSLNSPKSLIAHQNGKLSELFVKDGQFIEDNEILAFVESTGNPYDIMRLDSILRTLKVSINSKSFPIDYDFPSNLALGEVQEAFQNFYKDYILFKSSTLKGYQTENLELLKKDLKNLKFLESKLLEQKQLKQLEQKNYESEYSAYKKLFDKKVISRSEFERQENNYLSSKYPIQEADISILNNQSLYNSKVKEITELEQTIHEQKLNFVQSINQCLSETSRWIYQHVIKSPVSGRVSFSGIIQKYQNVQENQELFAVNPGNSQFFGEILIPQYNTGKVRTDQKVIVKLQSYPFEQYGLIWGKLTYISDVTYKDNGFMAKVTLESSKIRKDIILKSGMQGQAEIVTDDVSLLGRFIRKIKNLGRGY